VTESQIQVKPTNSKTTSLIEGLSVWKMGGILLWGRLVLVHRLMRVTLTNQPRLTQIVVFQLNLCKLIVLFTYKILKKNTCGDLFRRRCFLRIITLLKIFGTVIQNVSLCVPSLV
jgi:hypothetical protein